MKSTRSSDMVVSLSGVSRASTGRESRTHRPPCGVPRNRSVTGLSAHPGPSSTYPAFYGCVLSCTALSAMARRGIFVSFSTWASDSRPPPARPLRPFGSACQVAGLVVVGVGKVHARRRDVETS